MTNTGTPKLRLKIETLRGAMAANGISGNQQLSNKLGISLATTKRIMSGEQQPSPTFLAAVQLRLNVPIGLIVEATERKRIAA